MMKKGKTQKNDDEKDWINARRIKQLQNQLTKESWGHIQIQTGLSCYAQIVVMLIYFL